GPLSIEVSKAEASFFHPMQHDACDQETRNHEKHIDADEPPGLIARKYVKPPHQLYREGAQALDVSPIVRNGAGNVSHAKVDCQAQDAKKTWASKGNQFIEKARTSNFTRSIFGPMFKQ